MLVFRKVVPDEERFKEVEENSNRLAFWRQRWFLYFHSLGFSHKVACRHATADTNFRFDIENGDDYNRVSWKGGGWNR